MRHLNHLLAAASVAAIVACGGNAAMQGSEQGTNDDGTIGYATIDYGATVDRDTARVRSATFAFRSLDAAVEAGYPGEVARCLDHPELGAMGYHHMNRALLDESLDVERPEILLYERTAEGGYALTGVEYIVPYLMRPSDATPPTIMGLDLKRADGLELWYLHAWIWKENPAGLFADWNPNVECRT